MYGIRTFHTIFLCVSISSLPPCLIKNNAIIDIGKNWQSEFLQIQDFNIATKSLNTISYLFAESERSE